MHNGYQLLVNHCIYQLSWANVGPAMQTLGALGRRCASAATRTGCSAKQTFVDTGHGWKAMNKVYNVTSEATGPPTNNTDIM